MMDMHVHSVFSYDGKAEIEEIIEECHKKGLERFCVTDHYEYEDGKLAHGFNYEEYAVTMEKFGLPRGVELGWDGIGEVELPGEFDFVLLGVHKFKEKAPAEELVTDYLERTLYVVKNVEFHALAHLDYPARYVQVDFRVREDLVEEVLEYLVKNGKVLEVNTAGLFKHGKPNPDFWTLEMYWDMGGRFITLGSDAHDPLDVARGFEEVLSVLKERFRFELVFVDGGRILSKTLR